ncbi:hypothetical protein G4Y73_10695 [Wenzhouxiangella sp. XN201]|uniref:hypothetical protein n=1 Tax=Wenzhouxiangella sp. XN201 TaxID=2710755 RepID=UPI0013C64FCF|nr:hypothetical protein [Wenzhouxiangella sp. XN201]NEZ04618.1 hypothetical protein [Wenzhouxiangella sp. XN201]
MKNFIITAGCFALTCTAVLADNHEDPEELVQRVYLDYVKTDQHDEFRQVTREWNACMIEVDADLRWSVYEAHTGNLNRYAFVMAGKPWGWFDRDNAELDDCYEQFKDRYYATIDKTFGSFDIILNEHSNHVDDDVDRKIAMVTAFELADRQAFLENVKKYTEASRENEWKEPYYFYASLGGADASGIYVVSPVASFADFDGDNGFWDMLKEHFGEEEFEKMRAQDRESIISYSTDIWVRAAELSHTGE